MPGKSVDVIAGKGAGILIGSGRTLLERMAEIKPIFLNFQLWGNHFEERFRSGIVSLQDLQLTTCEIFYY
jgi:hypothetical protein